MTSPKEKEYDIHIWDKGDGTFTVSIDKRAFAVDTGIDETLEAIRSVLEIAI